MKKVIALLVILAATLLVTNVRADVITEFGAGIKNPRTTSLVLQEKCHEVLVTATRPDDPSVYRTASCGGDDPLFVGWPVAYEWTSPREVFRIRAGWFHLSHWFDGGPNREVHLDCACVSLTVNWSKRGRNK